MKIRTIIFIVPLVLLAIALAEGLILVWRLFFLSVLVLLAGYLWTWFGIRGIRAQVTKPPDHSQVGEWFDEKVTLFNDSKIPKFLINVEEITDLPGSHNMLSLNLPPGNSHSWQTSLYCQRRGRYSLGSITATVTDPLGLFPQERSLGEPRSVLVYPRTSELPFFESSSLNGFGYISGYQSISQISPNASTVREYASGDSLNHIHWHSTAHVGELMVRVFDADRYRSGSQNIRVIVDLHQPSHLGEGEETTEEYGVTIAASLIKKYIDSGMRVGLAASGDQSYLFPLQTGEPHLRRMFEALAVMKATGEVTIDRFISDEMEHFKDDSITILITPSNTERVIAAVRELRKGGNLVVAILLESASFGGTFGTVNTVRSLGSIGVQVYVVRKGDELARALDSRFSSVHTRYI